MSELCAFSLELGLLQGGGSFPQKVPRLQSPRQANCDFEPLVPASELLAWLAVPVTILAGAKRAPYAPPFSYQATDTMLKGLEFPKKSHAGKKRKPKAW